MNFINMIGKPKELLLKQIDDLIIDPVNRKKRYKLKHWDSVVFSKPILIMVGFFHRLFGNSILKFMIKKNR